jgi:hypothetical protein
MVLFIAGLNLSILCQEVPIIVLESMRHLEFEDYLGSIDGVEAVTVFESISQFILIITFAIYTKWSIKSL